MYIDHHTTASVASNETQSELARSIYRICAPDPRCAICLGPVAPGCDVCGDPECCAEALKMDAALWAPETTRDDASNEVMP